VIGVPEAAISARPAFFVDDEPDFHVEVPGPLGTFGVDAFQSRLVGGEREFAELLHFVDDQLVDADLGNRQHVVLVRLQPVEVLSEPLLHPLDALARQSVGAVDALEQVGIGLDLIGDQLALELGRGGDELEGAMGDDDAVPLRGRGARQKPLALVLDEIGLVGDQDSGGRVELQELAARLGEAMTGHDHHRLGNETQPLLLHDRCGERERLSRSDGVGDIGRARSDDPPDRPLLVGVEADDARGAGNRQMRPVEVPGDEVVKAVVVNPRQPVGAIDVLPHPGLERRLDLCQLVFRGFGVGGVEDPFLDPVLLELVVDLRQGGVERVNQEFACVSASGAPVCRRARQAREGMDVDRPARDLDRVIDGRFDAKDLFREGGHDIGGDPRRAEAGGDVGRLEVLGQGLFERCDIALITRVERGGGLGGCELVADLAREIGVGCDPGFSIEGDGRRGIEEDALAEFRDRRLARPAEELGDAVEIDEARFV
jgi:hypothetical protein